MTGDAFPNLVASEAPAGLAGEAAFDFEGDAAAAYRSLMGASPQETKIDSDENFDKHVFASILALARTEGGPFADQAGLSGVELKALLSRCFSDSEFCAWDRAEGATAPDDEEIEMVRDLLLAEQIESRRVRSLARRHGGAARRGAQSFVGRSWLAGPFRADKAYRTAFSASRHPQ